MYPDPVLKTRLWADLSDVNTKESLYWYLSKAHGFMQPINHFSLLEPYIPQIYDILPSIGRCMERQKALEFMKNLNPTI